MDRYFVMDRYYNCYRNFDRWQEQQCHFVCCIKASSKKKILVMNPLPARSNVFYDALVLLGSEGINQSRREVRVIGYQEGGQRFWIATDRLSLAAEEIVLVYSLRRAVKSFFAWWEPYLAVYPLVARSRYGLLVQVFSGLTAYLLLAIYCHEEQSEKVSLQRLREVRNKIRYASINNMGISDSGPKGIANPVFRLMQFLNRTLMDKSAQRIQALIVSAR